MDLTPQEWLELIGRHAPRLRAGGVTVVELAGCKFQIAEATVMPEPTPAQPRAGSGTGDIWRDLGVPEIEREEEGIE